MLSTPNMRPSPAFLGNRKQKTLLLITFISSILAVGFRGHEIKLPSASEDLLCTLQNKVLQWLSLSRRQAADNSWVLLCGSWTRQGEGLFLQNSFAHWIKPGPRRVQVLIYYHSTAAACLSSRAACNHLFRVFAWLKLANVFWIYPNSTQMPHQSLAKALTSYLVWKTPSYAM